MKLSVEQIPGEAEEEVVVRCYDAQEKWVEAIRSITAGEIAITGCVDEKTYRLKLSDVYYFEVLEGRSFLYCEKTVLECRQKLYEFEALCEGSMLFRCSKSMILNADKIECVRPSVPLIWNRKMTGFASGFTLTKKWFPRIICGIFSGKVVAKAAIGMMHANSRVDL